MNFKHSAFIKITDSQKRKEVIEFLEKIGYVRSTGSHAYDEECIFTSTRAIKDFTYGFVPAYKTDYYTLEEFGVSGGRINCEENIELFKAIVAINDENDYLQWFVNGKSHFICTEYFKNEFFEQDEDTKLSLDSFFKATPEQLINHFKE